MDMTLADQKFAILQNQVHDLVQGQLQWQQTVNLLLKIVLKNGQVPKHLQQVPCEKCSQPQTPDLSDDEQEHALTKVNPKTSVPLILEPEATKEPISLAQQILQIIQRYGQHHAAGSTKSEVAAWAGFNKFLPKVETWVNTNQPVRMILPAFPWKSINRKDKVIGHLPDLGEELALARLDNMCKDIKEIYEHGAEVIIATDGLIFNDLVGISDEETWEYSKELLRIAADKGFENVKLLRITEILGHATSDTLTKEVYLAKAEECRGELAVQFGNPDKVVSEMIHSDPDTKLTYCGFIRFLELDLKHSPVVESAASVRQFKAHVRKVAMEMMTRAEARDQKQRNTIRTAKLTSDQSFTKIILAKYENHVRLSIHPSSGAVKLSIPLIPQASGAFPRSPWHCAVAVGVDGSYKTIHAEHVRATHDLIHQNGRPYYFREKSELYDWDETNFSTEHLYPTGFVLRSKKASDHHLTPEELEKLRKLAAMQSRVAAYGFANMDDGVVASVV